MCYHDPCHTRGEVGEGVDPEEGQGRVGLSGDLRTVDLQRWLRQVALGARVEGGLRE